MQNVHAILSQFRAAALRRSLGESLVSAALCAGVVLFCGAAWLAWGPAPAYARPAILALAALGSLGIVLAHTLATASRFGSPEALAAWLEDKQPELRTDVRSALEFEGRPLTADPEIDALRASLALRVERHLTSLRSRLGELVPRRDLRRRGAALAALLVAFTGLVYASPDGFGAGAAALVFGVSAQDDEGKIVAARPLVSTVDYEVNHPVYTRRPARRVLGSTGDIRALTGSEIVFQARALMPVTDAVLRVERDGETRRIQLDVIEGIAVAGRFTVDGSATYRFELRGLDGEEAVDPIVRRIEAIPDAAPTVELLEPGEAMEVTPDQIVDIEYIARDDFGLSAVSVVWYFAGDEANKRQMPLQGTLASADFREHVPFDLQPLHLQPRDEVIVYVEATDNDQISGAKTGASRPISLRVASPDDRHNEVLALKEELFEQLLRQLGGALGTEMVAHAVDPADGGIMLVPNTGTPEEHGGRIAAEKESHARWLPTVQLYEALLALMDEDELSIDADREMLRGSYERLYEAILDEGRVLEAFTAEIVAAGVAARDFGLAANRAATTLATTERTILILEDLVATHRADNVERAMEELADVRERLQEMLEQYRDTQDPELREQIERELRRLEQRMRELLAELAAQVEQLPVEHLNADAIEPSELAENISDMTSAMDQIREMLDAGDIDAALELLEQLEADLAAMDQELQPLGDAQPQTLNEFDRQMGELMDELNNLQSLEADVEAQTQELLDEMIAERAEQMRDQARRALEEALEKVERAQDRLEATDDERLGSEAQQAMEGAAEGLGLLEQLLSQEDAAGAEAAATRMLSQLSDAQWELRREESMLVRDPQGRQQAQEAQRSMSQADQAVREVREQMRELMEAAQPSPNAEQRQQLQQLGEQQGEVQQRMEQMQGQVSEMGERFPMVQETLQPTLEEAGRHMQGAQSDLRGQRPRPALRNEQAALESMQQMRDQMRQLTQRQRQRDQRQSGGRRPDDQVEVPQDGESGRADFRRRVIESMRSEGLEAYEEEIRQYYESLLE